MTLEIGHTLDTFLMRLFFSFRKILSSHKLNQTHLTYNFIFKRIVGLTRLNIKGLKYAKNHYRQHRIQY